MTVDAEPFASRHTDDDRREMDYALDEAERAVQSTLERLRAAADWLSRDMRALADRCESAARFAPFSEARGVNNLGEAQSLATRTSRRPASSTVNVLCARLGAEMERMGSIRRLCECLES